MRHTAEEMYASSSREAARLPVPAATGVFDLLVAEFDRVAARAGDMIIRQVTNEVEADLKAYVARCVAIVFAQDSNTTVR
jgi:hypothetical protein